MDFVLKDGQILTGIHLQIEDPYLAFAISSMIMEHLFHGAAANRIIALSSCEAEYVAVTDAMKEGNYLRQLLADMTGSKRKIIRLHADNQGAIALSKNAVHHKRTKHIDIRYHFIRYEVENNIVNLVYVPSDKNTADMFTKPLPLSKLAEFISIRG